MVVRTGRNASRIAVGRGGCPVSVNRPAAVYVLVGAAGLLVMAGSQIVGADPVNFDKQILPIFKEQCFDCHGPKKQESGLRLDRRQDALAGGDTGPAIVPGDVSSGLLLKYVQSEDAEQVMPPKGDRLTRQQIELLRRWIEDGAKWSEETGPVGDRAGG